MKENNFSLIIKEKFNFESKPHGIDFTQSVLTYFKKFFRFVIKSQKRSNLSYFSSFIFTGIFSLLIMPGCGKSDSRLPSAPISVSAYNAGSGKTTISWSSVSDATSYNIYWSTTSGVTRTTGTQITNPASPYTHTGLINSETYYYVVTAVNTQGESRESSQVSAMPYYKMFKLPDTGQTGDYTTIFGEDSDYIINPPTYKDNGNGIITDKITGLIWQKEDDDSTRTWADAGTYCENLSIGGYTDWRLPSKKELISIVDYGTNSPSINTTYFLNTNSSYFWSSTSITDDQSSAWSIGFDIGGIINNFKTYYFYVRCVRGGQ